MTVLLITGSRSASERMLKYAQKAVARAKELGWEIVVGDASGVDAAVIEACDNLNVPVTVYGAYGRMRHQTKTGTNYALTNTSYPQRDMVMAQTCDVCLAVWDGKSNGTQITFSAAKKFGKEVHIFSE
jgi:hypothetical protein